ncbi:unnamed protein product [Arabis nemorensis]|uniref:Uncharacterized protein n=1 Tax=Arabis nemorensis TaxID=586526 RepID=A0A565CVX2_9BRAS|nr:unnamed protein product [Arabis nemorensis]
MASAIGELVKRSMEKIGVWNLLLLSTFPVLGYSIIQMEREVQELRVFTKNKYEELKAKEEE